MIPLDIRLSLFYIKDFHTWKKIEDAKVKTLREIRSLWECGVISIGELVRFKEELT